MIEDILTTEGFAFFRWFDLILKDGCLCGMCQNSRIWQWKRGYLHKD